MIGITTVTYPQMLFTMLSQNEWGLTVNIYAPDLPKPSSDELQEQPDLCCSASRACSSSHAVLGTAVLFACSYARPALGRTGTDN